MAKYIYFVGRPYPFKKASDIIRSNGYKVGLFLDKTVRVPNPAMYDSLIEVDFTSPAAIRSSLKGKDITVDGLVCSYENYIVAKARLAEIFNVTAISLEAAQMSTDKYLMRQAFKRLDPTITPDFGSVSSKDEALNLATQLRYPLILKPANLVKSLLVMRCNNEAELVRNFDYAQQNLGDMYKKQRVYGRQPRLILEEYMVGKTCSVAAFIDKNGQVHFCEGIVSLVNAQDINIDDNYIYKRSLPGDFPETLEKKMFNVARKGVLSLGMTSSPAHIELVYNDSSVKIIEIGARIGGYRPRMYSLSYGLDLISQEIGLALDQAPNLAGQFQAYSAVYELFPESDGEFTGLQGEVDGGLFHYFSVKAKPAEKIGPAKKGYKAAAVVIVSDSDRQEFARKCKMVDSIKVCVAK